MICEALVRTEDSSIRGRIPTLTLVAEVWTMAIATLPVPLRSIAIEGLVKEEMQRCAVHKNVVLVDSRPVFIKSLHLHRNKTTALGGKSIIQGTQSQS